MNNQPNQSAANVHLFDPPAMKPCPFCGGTDTKITGWNGGMRAVKCNPCDITGPVGYKGFTDDRGGGHQDMENRYEAVIKWNERAAHKRNDFISNRFNKVD